MKKMKFSSPLAGKMNDFVSLRRLSGTDYHSQTKLLLYFDNFLVKQNFQLSFLSREIIDNYFANLSHLSPRSWHNRFSVVRQFCYYLHQRDPRCYVPESVRVNKSYFSHKPYIFAETEIQKLLYQASQLPPPSSLRPHTYRMLFGVLYTTGIRIGEALALNINDVYLNNQRIHIRQGKFHKERWIPLSPSTCMMIEKYFVKRQNAALFNMDDPLFMSLRHTRLHHCTVHATFRILLDQCNIHSGTDQYPRIHDLRHSFAVTRLLQWYRDGLDVNVQLPALSTYMGHVDVRYTHIYLQATPELFEEANKRFLKHYRQHIKKGGINS